MARKRARRHTASRRHTAGRRHTRRHTSRRLLIGHRLEVDDLRLRDVLGHAAVGATDTGRRRNTLASAVGSESLAGLMRRYILDISLLRQVNHAKDNLSVFRSLKVDVFSDLDQIID